MAMIELGDTFLMKGYEWEVIKENQNRQGRSHWFVAENYEGSTCIFLSDHMYHWVRNGTAVLLPRGRKNEPANSETARSTGGDWPES